MDGWREMLGKYEVEFTKLWHMCYHFQILCPWKAWLTDPSTLSGDWRDCLTLFKLQIETSNQSYVVLKGIKSIKTLPATSFY